MPFDVPALPQLGPRIAILGPSGSGKPTLAAAVSGKRHTHPVHLDLLHHFPGTEWKKRPLAEFEDLNHEAITWQAWEMDGNYTSLIDPRLLRATGLIWLDLPLVSTVPRYL